jgi:tetratricopeptide (TPR) repeat protein
MWIVRYTAPAILIAGVSAIAVAAAAETARVEVGVTEDANGARIALKKQGDAPIPRATAQVAGGVLTVRFDAPVEADVSGLPKAAPRTIAAARREGDGKSVRISLRRTLQAQVTQGDAETLVTLTPTTTPITVEAVSSAERAPAATNATLSIGARPDLTRLSFHFAGAASVTPVRNGSRLELRFSRPAEIDLTQLRATPPLFVRSAERVSRPGGRLTIALNLEDGVRVRQFVEGSRIVVDLSPPEGGVSPATPPPAPPPPQASDDPAPRSGIVPIGVEEGTEETRFTVSWAGPARAAAFRRGDAVWLLFDTSAKFDVRGARRTEITPVRGDKVAGIRIAAPASMNLSARAQGNAWIFTLGPRANRLDAAPVRRDVGAGGRGRLVVDFDREGVVRKIVDPVVGDTLTVALTGGAPRGIEARRATSEAAVLATAQGGAVELRGDQAGAVFEGRSLVIARGAGADAPSALEAVAALDATSFLDVSREAATPIANVLDRKDELERRAAAEGCGEGARVEARMALARFLLAHELSAEALGALKVASVNQPQLEVDPAFRLMRAASNVMMGRVREAKLDLDASALADDPAAALWRGYAAFLQRDWATARKELERGKTALGGQPPGWRPRFELALAESLLSLRDLDAAAAAAARAMASNPAPEVSGDARIVQAKIAEARGDSRAALASLKALTVAPQEIVAVRASFEAARVERTLGATEEATIEQLEALRLRWRGDSLELEVVQQLARIYADRGRYREALMALRGAAGKHADHALGRTLRADMSDIFERLFLDGDADKLQPVQALGLFYDFKDLTPVGPNGDRMVRNLAGRLVALDLLEQAAVLLQHQVEERLEGVGRAQIAADLAMIYLRDRKPEKALAAIELSRQPNMPTDLLGERRILEARAFLDLGRTEQAVEILERDRSPEAQRIRADAAWRDRDWPRAAAELKLVVAQRQRGTALGPAERNEILRTAIALVFAENAAGVQALRKDYGPMMAGTPDADSFEVVTAGIDASGAQLREIARVVARTDLLDRFLREMKSDMTTRQPPQAATQPSTAPRA